MKKKLTVAVVLILLIAVCATIFAGCDEIFKPNAERDAKQVVATVSYENQNANVYKFELQSSFNSYAYYYVNYYGMTYEATTNYLVRSLAQRELLVLFAKEYVANYKYGEGVKAPNACTIQELLSKSEYDRAIDNTNTDLLSSLRSIIESNITEDNYNSGSSSSPDREEDDGEITDAVYIRFNSNGGSAVDRQTIQKGKKATEPTDPTYTGYTFYGWYTDRNCTVGNEFDFETAVDSSITLYAKWVDYVTPRTEMPEPEEEEEDYDPDAEDVEVSAKFFTTAFLDTLYDEIKDEDFVNNIKVPSSSTLEAQLRSYIDEGVSELRTNLTRNLFMDSVDDCYEYYLNSQMKTLLITKLERLIGKDVTVSRAEIDAEFERIVAQNKETFGNSSANYQTALTEALATTYFHTSTDKSYGFVINILLQLDSDAVSELTTMQSNGASAAAVTFRRNQLVSEMMVNVSNPSYKADADVDYGKDAEGNDIEIRDPMTDPNNKYNDINPDGTKGKTPDSTYQKEGGNNYSQILSFEKVDEEYQIVYNATEAPSMAYLLDKVSAFDVDGKVGIIHQIHNSFNQVTDAVAAGEISRLQGVYWLREVATAWLYLVGDDSGSVTESSNNGGLGYLVTPDGEESTFIEGFTEYARALIDKGTGAYTVGNVVDDDFKVSADGSFSFSGNKKAFVIADNLQTASSSSAYGGVFVLLASYKVWDENAYSHKNADGTDAEDGIVKVDLDATTGKLPYNYVVTYGKTDKECVTIYDMIHDSLLTGKKTDLYNLTVNSFGLKYSNTISYNEKVYKSLWKGLD